MLKNGLVPLVCIVWQIDFFPINNICRSFFYMHAHGKSILKFLGFGNVSGREALYYPWDTKPCCPTQKMPLSQQSRPTRKWIRVWEPNESIVMTASESPERKQAPHACPSTARQAPAWSVSAGSAKPLAQAYCSVSRKQLLLEWGPR